MKAVVKTKKGVGHVELLDVPKPRPGPSEILVEVKAAGICGTDIHIYRDEYPYNPPVVLGHEFCGVIAEVGENIEGWEAGDRVTCETAGKICGRCFYCRTGRYNLCPQRKGFGYDMDGAFARYILIPRQKILHTLPENVDFVSGALCEPSASVTHAVVDRTRISGGDFVVVTGDGPIGLLALQLARIAGAGIVVVTGLIDERLSVAEGLGADMTINVGEEDPVDIVRDLTGGFGADVVLECSGSGSAVRQALQFIKRGGALTQIGLFGKPLEVDLDQIVHKEIQIAGTFSQRWEVWERALNLIGRGRIRLKPLVTHVFGLEEWMRGFEIAEKRTGIKVVLTPC